MLPEPGEVGSSEALAQEARKRRRKRILAVLLALLVLLLAILFGWYLLNRKPIELPGLSKQDLPQYSFSLYGATRPMGVAVSTSGDRVYVTGSDGAKVVQVYDRAGKEAGTLVPPKSTGLSHVPVYVAVDPTTNDVYVSDRASQAVYVYDEKGAYRRTFVPRGDLGKDWQPLGLAFGKRGALYVTEVSGAPHQVLVFRRDGTLARTLGSTSGLTFPNGIVVDEQGKVYVSDSNNGRLVIFDPAGKVVAAINRGVAAGDLGLPRGAAIDGSDRLYIVDTAGHTVRVYRTADGKSALPRYLGTFGVEGQTDGTFEYPNGVATDDRDRVYVTDRENNRVQVWSY